MDDSEITTTDEYGINLSNIWQNFEIYDQQLKNICEQLDESILMPDLNKTITSYISDDDEVELKVKKLPDNIKSMAIDIIRGYYNKDYQDRWRITSPITSDDKLGSPIESIPIDEIDFENQLDTIFYFEENEEEYDRCCVVIGKLKNNIYFHYRADYTMSGFDCCGRGIIELSHTLRELCKFVLRIYD